MPLSRRRFLANTAALALARPTFADGRANTREVLQQLSYGQVTLTAGPLADHYRAIQKHYLSLSNDRLLKVYRQRAGLPAPGHDMGGWYDLNGFVPGHSLGQYISGLARLGAATSDPACIAKVHELVAGFAETLGPRNQSILRPETNLWVCYTLDKHFAGLIDAATLAKMPEAAPLLTRVLDGAQHLLPAQGRDRIGKKEPPYDETFIMPENLFAAAALTGNPAFESLAQRYMLDRELFDPLARGEDPLPGQHAYSHAIALSSAGAAYLRHGDAKYRDAMKHAFTLLTTEQQFASGGWGPNETFIHPHRGELFAALTTTPDHFETPCGSYAATKLARYLLRTTPAPTDTRHGDNLERVLFNTILATRFPDEDGDYPYYSTYGPAARKTYYQAKWPCCSGTLVQTVADYPLNVAFHDEQRGLCLNLYTPSEIRFTHRGTPITMRQQTTFPVDDTIDLALAAPHPVELTIFLRIPFWCARTASVSINNSAPTQASAGTWAAITRRWRSGDTVRLTLPQDFRFEPIDDLHRETVALMRGPVQYVALNAPLPTPHLRTPAHLRQTGPERFTEGALAFVPLYRVRNEIYTSYFSRA